MGGEGCRMSKHSKLLTEEGESAAEVTGGEVGGEKGDERRLT